MNDKLKILNNGEDKKVNIYHMFNELSNNRWKKLEKTFSKEYWDYRKDWETIPKNLNKKFMHIDIEITNFCNLRCTFCSRTVRVEKGDWRKLEHMKLEDYKKIIDDGVEAGIYAVNLNFLGEAFMHPNLFDMIKYAKDSGILDVFVHTNGTLMDESKFQSIIDSGLDKLSVSIDSPYAERFEKLRVGSKFDVIFNNIKNFCEFKNKIGSIKPLTRINFIKLPDTTEQEIKDMYDLCSPFIDSLALLDYVEPEGYEKIKLEEIPEDFKSSFVCPQILSRLMIHSNSKIFACCIDYDDELELGNVKEDSLLDAWNSDKLNYIRKKHLEGRYFEIETCRNCDFAYNAEKEIFENFKNT